ncbi:DUF2284 domain-containing protein [Pseudoramibacter alactolyticus]|uniref:DUF2284 domain-containing protein n=1 Tax=Pseudoramibacter alactolyticus TaxID=113287 RepID=UPI00248D4077|nr:DUF2284 domain-containing protein [Pseudoramibacter alactolyticus]
MMHYDPHEDAGQYLEDLATAYWASESLFAALGAGLFTFLADAESADAGDIAAHFGWKPDAAERFLWLLRELGLVDHYDGQWFNTVLSRDHLIAGAPADQRANIHWREALKAEWATLPAVLAAGTRTHFPEPAVSDAVMDVRRRDYLQAMDAVIAGKLPEILPMALPALPKNTRILDVGAGSGAFGCAFLKALPEARAELMDIRQMLPITAAINAGRPKALARRVTLREQNILDRPWDVGRYDLIILSNIVHATGRAESAAVLAEAARHLTPGGLLLVHDFFTEHRPLKSRLSDINMMVNTYNGRAYSAAWVKEQCEAAGLAATAPVPLSTDTAVVFAAADPKVLARLAVDRAAQLIAPVKSCGFLDAIPFDPKDVVFADFARHKCAFGCSSAGAKTCAVNDAMSTAETMRLVRSYQKALLLRGEPPTGDFQRRCLQAEALAFKAGFYKAFVFWAGPCSICPDCDPDAPCANPKHHRPSMEGSGIDVYATTAKAGEALHTLRQKGEVVKYYALLLLE